MSQTSYIDYILEHDLSEKKEETYDQYMNRTHNEKMILMYVFKSEKVSFEDLCKKLNMAESDLKIILGKMTKLNLLKTSQDDDLMVILTKSGSEDASHLIEQLNHKFTKYICNYLTYVKDQALEDDQEALKKVIDLLNGK